MFEAFNSIRDLENAGFRRALTKPRVAPRVEGLKKQLVERLLDDYSHLSLPDEETEDDEEDGGRENDEDEAGMGLAAGTDTAERTQQLSYYSWTIGHQDGKILMPRWV